MGVTDGFQESGCPKMDVIKYLFWITQKAQTPIFESEKVACHQVMNEDISAKEWCKWEGKEADMIKELMTKDSGASVLEKSLQFTTN